MTPRTSLAFLKFLKLRNEHRRKILVGKNGDAIWDLYGCQK